MFARWQTISLHPHTMRSLRGFAWPADWRTTSALDATCGVDDLRGSEFRRRAYYQFVTHRQLRQLWQLWQLWQLMEKNFSPQTLVPAVPVAKAFPKTAIADHSEGISFQRISCYGHPYKANPLHWVSPLPHRFLWSGWNKTASAARVCPRANCMGGMRPMCQRQMLDKRWLPTPIMKFIEGPHWPHSSFFRGQSGKPISVKSCFPALDTHGVVGYLKSFLMKSLFSVKILAFSREAKDLISSLFIPMHWCFFKSGKLKSIDVAMCLSSFRTSTKS